MWDFGCPQLAGWAGSLLPEQPNCQGNQTAPTLISTHISTKYDKFQILAHYDVIIDQNSDNYSLNLPNFWSTMTS